VYLNKRPMSNVFKTKQIVRHFANSASKGFGAMSSIVYRPVRQKTREDIWILGATLPFLFPSQRSICQQRDLHLERTPVPSDTRIRFVTAF